MKVTFFFLSFLLLIGTQAYYSGVNILPSSSLEKTSVKNIYKFVGTEADLVTLKNYSRSVDERPDGEPSCEYFFWKHNPIKRTKLVYLNKQQASYKEFSITYELYTRSTCEPDFLRQELAFLTIDDQVFVLKYPTWSTDHVSVGTYYPDRLNIAFAGQVDVSGPFDWTTFVNIYFETDADGKMQPVRIQNIKLNF